MTMNLTTTRDVRPAPRRCYMADVAKAPLGSKLRLMGTVVSILQETGGSNGGTSSLVVDDGSQQLGAIQLQPHMLSKLASQLQIGSTVDCLCTLKDGGVLHATTVSVIQDERLVTLRSLEIALQARGKRLRDVKPPSAKENNEKRRISKGFLLPFSKDQLLGTIQSDAMGWKVGELAKLLVGISPRTLHLWIKELQEEGQIYQDGQGRYKAL